MAAPPNLVYVGTYTRAGHSTGIHVLGYDPSSGRLRPASIAPEIDPSFLAFDSGRRFLFATSEGFGRDGGAVVSFQIDPHDGHLTALSRQPTGGGEPCHLCVDPSDRWLLVANHEHGCVTVFPVDQDGHLGPASHMSQHEGSGPGPTQTGPHAHHVTFDPAGERVLVTDKGIDQVVVYKLDRATGKLVPNDPPYGAVHAGAAPRHLAFGRDGRYAYVNGEADMTLALFSYDASSGTMHELQVLSTLPDGISNAEYSTAEVEVHPLGHFVYVSNRGHDSIAGFRIGAGDGRLAPIGHVSTGGRTPRHFAIDPTGRRLFVGNQGSNTIVEFALDSDTGQLTATGQIVEVGAPACILFS